MALIDTLKQGHTGMFGSVLGIHFVEATPDRIVAEMDVRPDLCTVPGILHGGAIMGFADALGGSATALNLPAGAGTTTIESKTNFFAPGRTGETIRGECLPLHRGKTTMVWQTRVTSPEGRLIALITQTQMVLTPRQSAPPAQSEGEMLASLFAGKSHAEQKALLATLERAGAATYRVLAANETDPAHREVLLAAAIKEEENAETLEKQA